jgi:tetratricopeptide (TPR) repeat protein
MKPTLLNSRTSRLAADESALLRCQTALELKDRGEYFKAGEVMRPLWKGLGTRPEVAGLHPTIAAEVLLCVGILTRWIGSRNQSLEAQTLAKDLITESLTLYESSGDVLKVAAARSELAYCYWREGAFSEARIWFNDALQRLTAIGATRANAILGLAVVEWSDARYAESLRLLTANATLFEKIGNQTLKGAYHTQVAIVLRSLITAENRTDHIQRAISEYEEADNCFRSARHIGYRADVKNNVGFLLYKLSRYPEAHQRINEARRLATSIKDRVRVAQMDETEAQVFIAEGRFTEAEKLARHAVSILEKTDHYCLLADMLITHGIALARLPDNAERAHIILQRAIEIALQVDAFNKAGVAALTVIEELADQLEPKMVMATYDRANYWLSRLQENQEIQSRLNAAARQVLQRNVRTVGNKLEPVFKPCNLRQEILRFESTLIKRALVTANGRITKAAALLGMSHQSLSLIISTRHPELLSVRSPVRRRSPRAK